MAVSYFDPSSGFLAWAIQGRTDAAESPVDDTTGREARLVLEMFTPGIVIPADGLMVSERASGVGMFIDIAPGVAIVESDDNGKYGVEHTDAPTTQPLGGADLSNPRIDSVFLVPRDRDGDAANLAMVRFAIIDGTPASSPVPPAPDPNWDVWLRLADITVGAGATEITDADITDQRVRATVVPDGVATASIQAAAVTAAKLAAEAVVTAAIANLAVTTGKLATDAVTTAKIASNAVTNAELADNAVGSTNIQSGAVLTSDLANLAVTSAKIAANAVTSSELASGAVATGHIQNGAVTSAKVDNTVATRTGVISGNRIHIGGSAPGSPQNGDIWIDTSI